MAANDDAPSPASPMRSSSAPPIVPDSDSRATGPGPASGVANVAWRRTAGSVLITPRQLGPSSRMPKRRAIRRAAADSAAPSGPDSAKPAEITITARTPLRPHSRTTSGTSAAGTTTTARSTGPSMASRDGWARTPATWSASRLTG